MSKKILFIGDNVQGFLIKALIKSLNEADYQVAFAMPDINHLELIKAEEGIPQFIILYLERLGDSDNRFFSYIQNYMENEGKRTQLYFIGSMVEINQAYEVIQKVHVKRAFERPVDTDELIKALERDGGDYAVSSEVKEYKIDEDKKSIMIIDDEVMQLRAMSRWLEKTYNVFTEKSGTDAIGILKQYHVDMILLDYEMPVLSGYEVFQLLKSDPDTSSIPVVFLTGNDDSEIVKQVVALHPAGYLLKSTAPMILAQKIDGIFKALEEAKNPKPNYYYKK